MPSWNKYIDVNGQCIINLFIKIVVIVYFTYVKFLVKPGNNLIVYLIYEGYNLKKYHNPIGPPQQKLIKNIFLDLFQSGANQ